MNYSVKLVTVLFANNCLFSDVLTPLQHGLFDIMNKYQVTYDTVCVCVLLRTGAVVFRRITCSTDTLAGMHTHMYTCMYIHTHTGMYTHTQACTPTHTHACTHTHTHTHTHTEYMCPLTCILANQCTCWGIETRAALKEDREIKSLRQRLSSFGGYQVYISM